MRTGFLPKGDVLTSRGATVPLGIRGPLQSLRPQAPQVCARSDAAARPSRLPGRTGSTARSATAGRRQRAAARAHLCHPDPVLSSMRDSSGGPNLRTRALAVVVALLLGGPLTVAVVRTAAAALRLAV